MTIPFLSDRFAPDEADASGAQRTRARLLRAGVSCFAELGFHAASTRLIETAAGVKRNLIIHHWGSKEDFWKACFERLADAFANELMLADDQAVNVSGHERLRLFVRAFVRASAKFPEMHRIMLDEGKRDEERLRWIVERRGAAMKARVERLLQDARHLGAAPTIDASSFYYAIVGAAGIFAMAPECRLLFGHDPFDDAAVAAHANAISYLLIPDPPSTIGDTP